MIRTIRQHVVHAVGFVVSRSISTVLRKSVDPASSSGGLLRRGTRTFRHCHVCPLVSSVFAQPEHLEELMAERSLVDHNHLRWVQAVNPTASTSFDYHRSIVFSSLPVR